MGESSQTLGAVAHPGGFLVRRPELSVGVVRATSRVSGLEVELLARRPLDRRSATERQRDIRRVAPIEVAARNLLPSYDEGMDLRAGLLDENGRAHWRYPDSVAGSSGDHAGGESGPTHRALFRFPPVYDEAKLVLAWPEIGFPESVVTVPLPDRATVERATTSIWDAPVAAVPTTESFEHYVATWQLDETIEAGTTAAPPQVLHRGDGAAVVLTRLTAVGPDVLSMGLTSIAVGDVARALSVDRVFGPTGGERRAIDEATYVREGGPGGSVAVVQDDRVFWLRSESASFGGGAETFSGTADLVLKRPEDDVLDLLVTWPLAGLPEARARIPLDPG